jgi:hypothetical protein
MINEIDLKRMKTKHKTIKAGDAEGSGSSHVAHRRYPEWPLRRDLHISFRVVYSKKKLE